MIITIKGGKQYQKEYVRSMIEFCQEKLMPKMDNLEINVKMREFPKTEEAYGYCLAVDGPRPDRPREFELEIHSKMSLRMLLETVAHEMVHVKQYARGELYESERQTKHRWMGKWLNEEKIDYWDRPWEIEAMGRESGLFIQWAQKHDLGKRKWTKKD